MGRKWVLGRSIPELRLYYCRRSIFFVFFLLLSSPIFAAPPIPFDSWGGNGNITATCPGGFTCADNVVSDNMLQRIVTRNGTGESYIQLIIQDGAANNTGRFQAENFVNGSSNQGGISAKVTINQTGTENLDYTTILNLGWANSTGQAAIDLDQTVTDNYQGVGFDYNFNYQQRQDNQGNTTGYFYGIRETVTNSGVLNGSNGGGQDIHTFVLRRAGGSFTTGGSATLPSAAGMGGMGGGGGGGGMGAAAPAPAPAPAPATGGGTAAPAPAPAPVAGGGMGRSLSGRAASSGSSRGTTLSARNIDFTPPPNGFGLGSGAEPGSPQTAPPDDFTGPTDNVPPLIGAFPGSIFNNNETNSNNNNVVNDRNFAGGSINSNGNASGPAIPANPITAPTGNPAGMGMGGGPAGGTVSWGAGNEVQVIWIGQICPGCMVGGMGMGGMGGGNGSFSFQQYENLSNGSIATSRSITGTAPLTWTDPPFGPQPGL